MSQKILIDHNVPCFSPKFCINVVSNFSRILQSSQEKSRTKAMQNFGINKVHYDLCENGVYSHFNYNNGPTNKGGLPVVLSWFAATCLHVLSQFQALGRTNTCCGYDDHNLAPSNIKKQFHDTEKVLKKAKSFLNLG